MVYCWMCEWFEQSWHCFGYIVAPKNFSHCNIRPVYLPESNRFGNLGFWHIPWYKHKPQAVHWYLGKGADGVDPAKKLNWNQVIRHEYWKTSFFSSFPLWTAPLRPGPSQCWVCFGLAKTFNHADWWGAFPWLKLPRIALPFRPCISHSAPFIKPLIVLRYTWPVKYPFSPRSSTSRTLPRSIAHKRTRLAARACKGSNRGGGTERKCGLLD